MKITVTQEHIEDGKAEDELACPIALALRQQTNEDLAVFSFDAFRSGVSKSIPLPKIASDFINAFDYDKPVEPFTFDLPIEKGTK